MRRQLRQLRQKNARPMSADAAADTTLSTATFTDARADIRQRPLPTRGTEYAPPTGQKSASTSRKHQTADLACAYAQTTWRDNHLREHATCLRGLTLGDEKTSALEKRDA